MATGPRFNPLDTRAVGLNVVDALLKRPAEPLGELTPFTGAGIYAIYYTGPFPAYQPIATRNRNGRLDLPIYIGKAIPSGGRKGGATVGEYSGSALYRRLAEHAESIRAVGNLDVADFFCRFLVVDDVWIPLAESLLIARFSPLWNKLVEGFGNHDPGTGRHAGRRPRWDTVHPGRAWAAKCAARPETAEQLIAEITAYLMVAPNGVLDVPNEDGEANPSS